MGVVAVDPVALNLDRGTCSLHGNYSRPLAQPGGPTARE